MPIYTFYDETSGIQWDDMMSISEKEDFLKKNQQITQVPVPISIVGDHIMGVGPKVDGGFTERMQQIAHSNPGTPLADRYGGPTKTHNEIKTREVLKKHGVL